jgi:hypothetical protein
MPSCKVVFERRLWGRSLVLEGGDREGWKVLRVDLGHPLICQLRKEVHRG